MASGLESPEISLANKDVLVEIVPNQALAAAAPSQTAAEPTSHTGVGMRSHATAFEPLRSPPGLANYSVFLFPFGKKIIDLPGGGAN